MHYLAMVLLNGKKINEYDDGCIRSMAEQEIDNYFESKFDWRTDDAGRWVQEYPNNVLKASDDIEKFVSILNEHIKERNEELLFHLNSMKKNKKSNLEDIVGKFIEEDSDYLNSAYHLEVISSILMNEFGIDNRLLNANTCDASLNSEDIEEIKKHPDDYALVFFDCHW